MQYSYSQPTGQPLILERSKQAQVYGLFGLAMLLTLLGVVAGGTFAFPLVSSGAIFLLFIAEMAIIFTSRLWVKSSPLNYILFAAFPLLSGLTVAPLLMSIVAGYVNGLSILVNAAIATTLLSFSAALLALTTPINFGALGRMLLFSLIGLLMFGLLQLFIPALQGTVAETLYSGAGVIIFSLFLAYDIQRAGQQSAFGVSPFLIALSLYLDIFNLFIYVLRFMVAMNGRRR